jgi:hypothetical protein
MSRAAEALRFAAAPTFAVLALLNGGAPSMHCMPGASPIDGMGLMYALMCVFHMAPWLALLSRR